MADYTTYFKLEKPAYKTLRYDVPINANYDFLDLALCDFPSATTLGSAGNQSGITLRSGMKWRNTGTKYTNIYNESSAWEKILTDTVVCPHKDVAAPSTPSAGTFYHYSVQISTISCPHWKLSSGAVLKLFQVAHVADIDATTITALTNANGTADGTFESIGATNSSDVSSAIMNNFKECSDVFAILKTVVDDLRTKFDAHLAEHENMGLHATS